MTPEARARILAAAEKEPSRTRSQRTVRVLGLAVAAVAACGGLFAVLGPSALPASYVAMCGVGWFAVALLATAAAISRTRTMLGLPTRALVILATVTAPIVLAWNLVALQLADVGNPAPARAHAACLAIGVAFATVPFGLFFYVRRPSDPVHPGATGAAIGAAAGTWGGLLIHLHCAYADPMHALLGHVLPIAVLAAVGAVLGKRAL